MVYFKRRLSSLSSTRNSTFLPLYMRPLVLGSEYIKARHTHSDLLRNPQDMDFFLFCFPCGARISPREKRRLRGAASGPWSGAGSLGSKTQCTLPWMVKVTSFAEPGVSLTRTSTEGFICIRLTNFAQPAIMPHEKTGNAPVGYQPEGMQENVLTMTDSNTDRHRHATNVLSCWKTRTTVCDFG